MTLSSKTAAVVAAFGAVWACLGAAGLWLGLPAWAVLLSALPAAGVAGWTVSRLVRRPLERLLQAAEIAANGEWNVPIEVRGEDETGRLAKCLLTLTEELRRKSDSTDALGAETSHRRETERELREREEYYRRLFEYSNDAVFITDFDGRILEINNKACAMFGTTREELLRIPFMDLQLPEETGRSKAAYKTGTQTGSIRYETRFKAGDGDPIDVEVSASIVDMKKGILQNIVSNITERKEAERNLRESEEKFRTFMETASDLMFITDAEGRFSWMNQAMLYTLGYAREELIGVPFAEVLDRDHLESARMKRRQFIEWGENIHQLVWETKTRKKIHGEMKTTAIYDNDGKFRGIRGVFRDVTERKKVEESQRLAELGKLASDMAHEVNNQIAVISTRAAVAKMRKNAPEEVDKDLSVIVSQCEQVKDIVKRLLMFSKPSRGDFRPQNPADALQLVVQLLEDQFRKHNVALETRIEPGLPPVRMDEKQMQEVYMNLLRNAFEAMPDGGTITVTAAPDGDTVRIDFEDQGTGISEADMARIFDPFFTTKENGTGLGLSVCYGIVQAHKGDLKYKSRPGKGTTATVILPAAD
ncbi:MAG: PAS domain S-box protein [bacterium]|nr:PAS domain S-box protein [bacterium]